MNGGVRATVEIPSPGNCPVAAASESGAPVDEVDRAAAGTDGAVTEEFALDADVDPDVDAEAITGDGETTVYRFSRERGGPCACDLVEREGPPVADVQAREGALRITFRAGDVAEVRRIVRTLDETFETVRLRTLSRGGAGGEEADLVLVDRKRLTDKQREVLERALELGYFEYPKGANASEVAEDLGIARSTFAEHLSAAQSKLLDALLETDGADRDRPRTAGRT